ncbi:lamin tail domain-containing protein 2 isoform X2 [Tiliqua scincoides]|uniref:lamin tail domain-containing protein 2 isoform X2 n=1 Tax=Tiliqua scincoides TaxID=71010 RepID=UPI003462EF00
MKKHPVITRVSLMFTPNDFKRDDSTSSSSLTGSESPKPKLKQESWTWSACGYCSPQRSHSSPRDLPRQHSVQPVTSDIRNNASQKQDPQLKDNPRNLRLLLHQKDLEIKGLKNAAQRDPSDRLACILHEIVKPRSKQISKRPPSEEHLQKEQVNSRLEAIKNRHKKEMKLLEDKLVKSHLLIRHLQETVRTLSAKSDDEADTESSSSVDERTQIARESFELWSESGTKILPESSDLRLRRIPKHTSFVDAFHRFGSLSTSDEEKDEIISHVESDPGVCGLTEDSSEESLKTECKTVSEQSSLAVLVSQKSDPTSTDTKLSQSTWSLPSTDKIPPSSSVDLSHSQDYWNYITRKPTLEPLVDGAVWMPLDHGTFVPSTEECKRCYAAADSLKIVTVHSKGKFVRILNSLLNKEVDLSGYIIQQWIGQFPVSIYRFPFGTILPAQHHITVWAAGANLAHKQPLPSIDIQKFFKAGPDCTTILCDRNGQPLTDSQQLRRPTVIMWTSQWTSFHSVNTKRNLLSHYPQGQTYICHQQEGRRLALQIKGTKDTYLLILQPAKWGMVVA